MMPQIYLQKDLYDKIITNGDNVQDFVNKAVAEKLKGKN